MKIELSIAHGVLLSAAVACCAFLLTAAVKACHSPFEKVIDFCEGNDDKWWGGLPLWMLIWFFTVGITITFLIAVFGGAR